MEKYKSIRIIDRKPREVIVGENEKIIDRNPSREELKSLNVFPKENYKRPFKSRVKKYTEEYLLDELRRFEKKEGRMPTQVDFINNPKYPSATAYQIRFGGLNKALEKAGLSTIKRSHAQIYTDKELLNELRRFEKEHGRPPTAEDFNNNPEYPSDSTYMRRFGNWLNSLKLAGLNIDLIGHQGSSYRGRQIEITILYFLENKQNKPIDLSGENWNSYCDGIGLDNGPYDVKSSKLHNGEHYHFNIRNEDKDDDKEAIQWYYLMALNDNGTVRYAWKVPGEMAEKDSFNVWLNSCSYAEFTVENMKEYDITDKFKYILKRRIMRQYRRQAMEDLEKMVF